MTIDCADPHGLAQFWAQALDGTLAERIATGNA
ncbi:VOC family protein [Kitasatospora sp. NPDC058243]